MKIPRDSESYKAIKAGFEKLINELGLEKVNASIARGLTIVTAERIRWDLLHNYVGYTAANPGGIYTDNHIDTAIKAAAKELGLIGLEG